MKTRYLMVLACAASLAGCEEQGMDSRVSLGTARDAITDVAHTPVERQSIGNCWLYAEATWVESVHLAATGNALDASQSYWTYWHWFDQIVGGLYGDEISTGGNQWKSHALVRDRGVMREADFVPEDENETEMSERQHDALEIINQELSSGRLKDSQAREDGKLVREVLDEAWQLPDALRADLDRAFGEDGQGSLRYGASVEGTDIIDPKTIKAKYTKRSSSGSVSVRNVDLVTAITEWKNASYPSYASSSSALASARRKFLVRVQRALHDRQPVVITWNVDFNAMESYEEELKGSFNMRTLQNAGGPGRQGGHMTVLEDYEAETQQYGLLKAGTTLDPQNSQDAAKLAAALQTSTKIRFLRVKNSWGSNRPDRAHAPGFPGYHDLYMDYMNGPIKWCPEAEGGSCGGETIPFRDVLLPPGY
jgi:hypothetical protein